VDRDYYQVLGVPRDASTENIQQAYRQLARKNHPDVNNDPAAEDRFKEINEAYHVLADPKTRARYDRFGPDFRQIPEDFDPQAATQGFGRGSPGRSQRAGGRSRGPRAGASRGTRTGGSRVYTSDFGGSDFGDFDEIDIDDLFGGMFGARGATGPIPGADHEAELDLTVEEAYRGGRRSITLSGPGGPHNYQVTVPPGVTDGQRIRLAGQGGGGSGNGPAGDLYLVVRIAPHPRYRLAKRDIYVDLPVTPWEGALGATVPLTTPGGETKVKVPPGSSSGRRLRLQAEGMPNPRGKPGDLYAEVKIMVPPKLTAQEKRLFEKLAAESTFDPRRSR
jgi:curved DNA-binding protein